MYNYRLNTYVMCQTFFFWINLKYFFTVSSPGKPNGMFIKAIVFFIYPFGEDLIENVCEGQAKLGR